MYYIAVVWGVNVGIYSIHGVYGLGLCPIDLGSNAFRGGTPLGLFQAGVDRRGIFFELGYWPQRKKAYI